MKQKFLYAFMFVLGGIIGGLVVCYYRPAQEPATLALVGQSNGEGGAAPCKDTLQMLWPSGRNTYEVGDTIIGESGYFANEDCDYKMIYLRKHEHLDSTWAIFVKL